MNNIPILTISQLKQVLRDCFLNLNNPQSETQCVPIIWGPPGVGKSYIINELAEEMKAKVIPFFASGGDETEVDGIPVPNEKDKIVEYMPLEHQAFHKYGDQTVIWLWDEINRARPEVIQSLFKIVSTYPRTLGVRPIPKNVFIICCANEGEEDNTIVTDFNDASFYNKFAHFKIDFDKEEFLNFIKFKYAKHPNQQIKTSAIRVYNFLLNQNEDKFLNIPEDPSVKRSYPTPRTIERFITSFSKYIAEYGDNEVSRTTLMTGASLLGVSWLDSFCEYMTLYVRGNLNEKLSVKSVFFEKNFSKENCKELNKKLQSLESDAIMFLGGELEELFSEESTESLTKHINNNKMNFFLNVLRLMDLDSRIGKMHDMIGNEKFVLVLDKLGQSNKENVNLASQFVNEVKGLANKK